jgi:hypothetical protein
MPPEQKIIVKHRETEIEYDQSKNLWRFTLHGRERSSESLAKAKEAIDKPVPVKAKPFEEVTAWIKKWDQGWKKCRITSIADSPSYSSSTWVWVVTDSARSKQKTEDIYPSCEGNDQLISELQAVDAKIEALNEEKSKLMERLKCYIAPKEL